MSRALTGGVRSIYGHLTNSLDRSFSAFLVLTGPKASTVIIASSQFDFFVSLVSCYADRFGDENPGFGRQDIVSLSPVRLKRLEDILLSGIWTERLPIEA
jgi:hypothetical protein